MVRLTLLGTGTPAPSLLRQSSGYLLEIGDDVIVIDHGPGAAHRLLEAGKTPGDVTHLFLSHLHYDHMADYPRLVLQRWDMAAGSVGELPVYGPRPLAQITERLFAPDGVFGPDLESRTTHQASLDVYAARGGQLPRSKPAPVITEIGVGAVVTGKDWSMRAGQAQHFEPQLTCLGFRFETPAGVITYSGDNGGINENMVQLADRSDVLVHMCHYPSGQEPTDAFRQSAGSHLDVAETAERASARTLVLTHLIPMMDQPGVIEQLVGEMAEIYHGRIIVGRDLMVIPLEADNVDRID